MYIFNAQKTKPVHVFDHIGISFNLHANLSGLECYLDPAFYDAHDIRNKKRNMSERHFTPSRYDSALDYCNYCKMLSIAYTTSSGLVKCELANVFLEGGPTAVAKVPSGVS